MWFLRKRGEKPLRGLPKSSSVSHLVADAGLEQPGASSCDPSSSSFSPFLALSFQELLFLSNRLPASRPLPIRSFAPNAPSSSSSPSTPFQPSLKVDTPCSCGSSVDIPFELELEDTSPTVMEMQLRIRLPSPPQSPSEPSSTSSSSDTTAVRRSAGTTRPR
ncbi:MAG: hypothetical protein Q8P67_07225, partial [archaeon]|nr:hypothetical protein [archaeon]